jgi:hypothetical protein
MPFNRQDASDQMLAKSLKTLLEIVFSEGA